MNNDKLEKLISALDGANPAAFDMEKYMWSEVDFLPPGVTCGTPACVLGHYAHRKDLQDRFGLDKYGSVIRLDTGATIWYDSQVVLNHFGIDTEQAHALFGATGCDDAKTADEAADYIRRFIDSDGDIG